MNKQTVRELIDADGENKAVRAFLMVYNNEKSVSTKDMRQHMTRSGFRNYWPEWANQDIGHITKSGAQDWIRHLFSLEVQPAQAQPYDEIDLLTTAYMAGLLARDKKAVLDVSAMVDRFLAWPLPESVCPDLPTHDTHRIGTQLLTADEARQMFEYVLEGLAAAPTQSADAAYKVRNALIGALDEALEIIEKHTYPTPDKPNSRWARLQALKEILTMAKGA